MVPPPFTAVRVPHVDCEHDRFARETGITGPYQWAWEIKTVNGRGLEVRVRNPSGLDAVGEEARAAILKSLSRGQGQLNLTISKASTAPQAPRQHGGARSR